MYMFVLTDSVFPIRIMILSKFSPDRLLVLSPGRFCVFSPRDFSCFSPDRVTDTMHSGQASYDCVAVCCSMLQCVAVIQHKTPERKTYSHICVYVYIYIRMCLYTYMYIYIYMYTYLYVYMYICIYICIYVNTSHEAADAYA